MKLPFLDRTPGTEAVTYAEAQALLDDGLGRDLVLSLFPNDAEWLAPLLKTTASIREAVQLEPPSYYFEASLKAKFLAAGRPAQPIAIAVPGSHFRTAVAGLSVAAVGALMSLLTLGFISSSQAVPGDWNYTLKRANERAQYTLSTGNSRIDLQINHTQARVQEIQVRTSSGDVSTTDIQKLEREARDLTDLVKAQPLDDSQKAKIKDIRDTSTVALDDAKAKKPNLETAVISASTTVQEAYAAGVGGAVTPIKTPTATPTATSTSTTTVTASGTAPAGDAKASATADASPDPSPASTTTPPSSPTNPR